MIGKINNTCFKGGYMLEGSKNDIKEASALIENKNTAKGIPTAYMLTHEMNSPKTDYFILTNSAANLDGNNISNMRDKARKTVVQAEHLLDKNIKKIFNPETGFLALINTQGKMNNITSIEFNKPLKLNVAFLTLMEIDSKNLDITTKESKRIPEYKFKSSSFFPAIQFPDLSKLCARNEILSKIKVTKLLHKDSSSFAFKTSDKNTIRLSTDIDYMKKFSPKSVEIIDIGIIEHHTEKLYWQIDKPFKLR